MGGARLLLRGRGLRLDGRERRELPHQGYPRHRLGRLEQRSWETEAGEKRSIVEINADEIAPSLRFATAVVTRTPRAEGSSFSSSEKTTPRTNEPTSYAFDEEPF